MSAWELTPEARSFKVRRTVPANDIKHNVRSTSVHSPGTMVVWSAVVAKPEGLPSSTFAGIPQSLLPDLWIRISEFTYVFDLAG